MFKPLKTLLLPLAILAAIIGGASAHATTLPQIRVGGYQLVDTPSRPAEAAQVPQSQQPRAVCCYDTAPECCVAAETTINPAAVRFSQSSISPSFSTGGTIQDLATGLRNGTVNAADIPPIRLLERDGNLFTLDNRRLWSFQQAEVPIPYRMATPQEAAGEAWKFTTQNGGTTIRVRGQ